LDVNGEITESFFIYKPLVNKILEDRDLDGTRFHRSESATPRTSGNVLYPTSPQPQNTDQE